MAAPWEAQSRSNQKKKRTKTLLLHKYWHKNIRCQQMARSAYVLGLCAKLRLHLGSSLSIVDRAVRGEGADTVTVEHVQLVCSMLLTLINVAEVEQNYTDRGCMRYTLVWTNDGWNLRTRLLLCPIAETKRTTPEYAETLVNDVLLSRIKTR